MAVGLVLVGLALPGAVGAAPVGALVPPDYPESVRLLDRRIRHDGLDGGVLLVGRDGTWGGTADRITAETVMPIASASKWLTAALVMTFVDEGRLTLDTPVADLLPGFGGAKAAVTVRHLLSHTSGLVADACVYATMGSTASCKRRPRAKFCSCASRIRLFQVLSPPENFKGMAGPWSCSCCCVAAWSWGRVLPSLVSSLAELF